MRCLLLIGSSQTRTVPRPAGPLVFTPRRYPATVSESMPRGRLSPPPAVSDAVPDG